MKALKTLIPALLCAALATALARAADEKPLGAVLDELLPGMGAEDTGARSGPQQQWQKICWEAGAPGNEARRQEVCKLMAAKIGPETPVPARVWLLKQLERIGRGECVDAVVAQVDDKEQQVRDAACRALANNPTPEARAKLREKLAATGDNGRKVALINALGYRPEPQSVEALARELGNPDAAVAGAAARGLGKIATPEAARALAAVRGKTQGDLRLRVDNACLLCADKLRADSKAGEALGVYKQLQGKEEPPAVRLAALQGRLHAEGSGAPATILETLAGDDEGAAQAALGHVIDNADTAAVKAVAAGLSKLPAAGQVALLGALKARRDRAALPAVLEAAKSEDENVKVAAFDALAGLAEASTVPMLVEVMQAGGKPGDAARRSLESVFAKGVDEKLAQAMKEAKDNGQRHRFIEILERRGATSAAPALLELAVDEDGGLRNRAMEALGRLALPEHVPGMVRGLMKAQDRGARENAERAITFVCERTADEQKRAEPLLAVYASSDEATRTALLAVLGRVGGARALELVRAGLAGNDAERFAAAARGICNWPDASVGEDLVKLATTAKEEGQRIQAVRAIARVAVLRDDRPDAEKLALLKKAMERATRDEDRDLILDRARAIRLVETLRFVAPYLDNPKLAQRACQTVFELSHHLRGQNREEFNKALDKVIRISKDQGMVDRARQYRAEK